MSKKIVFLADSISTQTAGIHQFGRQLIESILQRFPEHKYSSIASSDIDIDRIEQHIIPIKSFIPSHLRIRQLTSIPSLLRRLNPDVVIELAHFGPFNLPAEVKRITVIHDLSAITHPQFHSYLSHIVQKTTLPGIIQKATSIITNSYFTKSEILRLFQTPHDKVQVLYPKLRPLKPPAENSRTAESKYFLCVGTIEPRKNYLTVVKAFEKIHSLFPDYQLIIAGKSGWKNKSFYKYVETSKAKKHIKLTGFVSHSELAELYAHAFAFISASHFEGFGIPIMEASNFGLPLLVAKNSSQYEIAKQAALFFDSHDINELKKQMAYLIEHENSRDDLRKQSSTMLHNLTETYHQQLSQLSLE